MRIIIDIQGCQSKGSKYRGIGRYSIALIKAISANFHEHEIILIGNSLLENISDNFSSELETNPNLTYCNWYCVGPLAQHDPFNQCRVSIAESLRSYAFASLQADIILLTSFFEGYADDSLIALNTNFNLPPISTIFYDLIPLINSSEYLDVNPIYKNFYLPRLKELSKLDCILAISNSSAKEALNYLDIDQDLIFNISSACDTNLFSKTPTASYSQNIDIKKIGKFILYSGAADPRKNLQRLVKAYSLLEEYLKLKYKLVFAGKLKRQEIDEIYSWIDINNIPKENFIFLGYVSDDDLANLYRNCSLYIFPSLHEGFGLPLLEAMNCGAIVLGSNTTSIPEVIGTSEGLFNPEKTRDIARLIARSLTDDGFRDKLRTHYKEQVKKFSWLLSAERTIEALLKVTKCHAINNNSCASKIDYKNQIRSILIAQIQNDLSLYKYTNQLEIFIKQISACIDLIDKECSYYRPKSVTLKDDFRWTLQGPYDSNYSLAIVNRNFALGLKSIGVNVSIFSSEGPGDYFPDLQYLERFPQILNLHHDSYSSKDISEVVSRNMYPPRVNKLDAKINLFHAYGWEETGFPSSWVDDFNTYLQGITVMSTEVKKILIDNGVAIPISVCGLGANHIEDINIDHSFEIKAKKFRFLHVSSCFPRKGIDCLLNAYFQAFSKFDDVTLIIKTFKNQHNNLMDLVKKYKLRTHDFPDILVIENDLNDSELKALYLSCDALVAPSFGEGFGLPFAEAMFLGLPVITTGWGGQTDFCKSENSWLIDYEFHYSKTHFGLYSSIWAKPSVNHLKVLMKEISQLDKDEIIIKTSQAKTLIKEQYSWRNVALKNLDFVKSLPTKDNQCNSKIGFITTWNSRCGIASYSKNLINKMSSESISILSPRNQVLIEKDDHNVSECWDLNQLDLTNLYDECIRQSFTSIVIQFNYGFFNFSALNQFIQKIKFHKISIFIFLHSTLDPQDKSKSLKYLSSTFELCDRLLVHTPSDMNRLKKLGLISNVSLFPHGILDFTVQDKNDDEFYLKRIKSIDSTFPHLATYGFCLPNKGFPELIRAISILNKRGLACNLSLLTAKYSSAYDYFCEELIELIESLNLVNVVSINFDYLSNEESLNFLSHTDLLVFPYQSTKESSSAAIRHGISSQTDIAVTPIPIFNDVSDLVVKLPGISPEEIADGLYEHLSSRNLNIEEERKDRAKNWRKQHLFSNLARRLDGLIKSIESENSIT